MDEWMGPGDRDFFPNSGPQAMENIHIYISHDMDEYVKYDMDRLQSFILKEISTSILG